MRTVTIQKVLAAFLGVALFAGSAAGEIIDCEAGLRASTTLNKRQKIKTFTAEFWRSVEQRSQKFPEALKARGIVVGDFHFANLGIYFDPSIDRARLTLNDLDDSGTHFLVGDLLKYLLYLKSLKKNVEFPKVVKAYEEGLRREKMEIPHELRALLAMKSHDFQKESAKSATKTREECERFDLSEITENQRKTLEEIEKLSIFQNLSSIQKKVQVNATGSSAGMTRYLFAAVSRASGVEGALEFKELACSATGAKDRQNLKLDRRAVVQYLNELTQVSEKSSFLSRQSVLWVNNKYLLMREKAPNYLKDLDIESFTGKKFQKYSEYFAYYLGFIHSQSATIEYKESILKNPSWMLEEMKNLNSEFKQILANED